MDENIFNYSNMVEAWTDFTKAAREYFVKMIKTVHETTDASIIHKSKFLSNRDYCARLMYLMYLLSTSGVSMTSEFDLNWILLLAKPNSVKSVRQSVHELMELGLIKQFELEKLDDIIDGGDTNQDTEFNFDD